MAGEEKLTWPLDHNKQQAINFRLQVVAGLLALYGQADMWYDATANRVRYVENDGTTVRSLANTAELAGAFNPGDWSLDDFNAAEDDVDLGAQKIINLADGSASGDAVNFGQLALKADTSYVDQAIADLVDGAPELLNTLSELATALQDADSDIAAINTAIAARARRFSASVGNGAATNIDITHNWNTRDYSFQVYDLSAPYGRIRPGSERPTLNTVRLKFTTAPTTDQYRVVMHEG